MAELLFLRDGELQLRAPLQGERIRLGRGVEADLILPDRAVSRVQCELVRAGDGWRVVDRSGRGTPVGKRVADDGGLSLRDGDELRLGAYVLVFSAHAASPDAERTGAHAAASGRTQRLRRNSSAVPARLRLRNASGEHVLDLPADEGLRLVIGREPRKGGVALDDRCASAEHCRIGFKDGTFRITDLRSENGTFVNGLRVAEAFLSGRAQLQVGETLLSFEQAAGPDAPADEALPGLVSRDPAMLPVIEQVRRLSAGRIPVAIHGETGTGKEVVARALHLLAPRSAGSFVALNCGALPKELVESELFGHEKGAFTGADRARAGAFEEASGGTLFLDEIGDLPLDVQVKLLRVLERGEIRRVGGNRAITVDVRIVSATHHDLTAAVEGGTFREDLFYRLCVATIELPPLRQRIADVLPMAEHFVGQFAPAEMGVTFSQGAIRKLEAHPWPGNARELRNAVQLALLQRSGPVITEEELVLRPPTARRGRTSVPRIEDLEREAYRQALKRFGDDRKGAMEALGVSKATFFRRLAEFGFDDLG